MFRKYQNIFRSRWRALWWAGGILLTAYCTVPSPDRTAGKGSDDAVAAAGAGKADGDDARAVAATLGPLLGDPQPQADDHANPWALDPDRPVAQPTLATPR